MANRFAVANGNFNATSTWSTTPAGVAGASVPVAGDNAYANSKTVTITADATCAKISTEAENGATGTGSFVLNSGVTLTANVNAGGSTCLSVTYNSPGSSTVAGNVLGGSSTNAYGFSFSGSGTLTVNGTITGGSASGTHGTYITGTGTLIVGGAVTGGSGAANGINIASAATVNVTGNVSASSASTGINIQNFTNSCTVVGTVTAVGATGISFLSNTGTLSVTGNVYGSNTTAGIYGINVSGAGTVTISGNCYGGTSSNAGGFVTSGAGTTTITGNVYGSDTTGGGVGAVCNNASANLNIIGSAFGGKQVVGANNITTGTLKVVRAVGNGHGVGSVGTAAIPGVLSSVASSLTYVEEIQYGSLGQSPTSGPIILTDKPSNVALFYRPSLSQKTLIDAASIAGALPATTDVRYGTVYNSGGSTGTCRVPASGSVALGVPVDATTGTAVLTPAAIWDTLTSTMSTSGSIGERLKNASTVSSTGQQLSDALRYT